MGKSAYVVDHDEIVSTMFEIQHGRVYENQKKGDTELWNRTCNKMDNDLEGTYYLSDIEESLESDPDNLLDKALLQIFKESKKKEIQIVRG